MVAYRALDDRMIVVDIIKCFLTTAKHNKPWIVRIIPGTHYMSDSVIVVSDEIDVTAYKSNSCMPPGIILPC